MPTLAHNRVRVRQTQEAGCGCPWPRATIDSLVQIAQRVAAAGDQEGDVTQPNGAIIRPQGLVS